MGIKSKENGERVQSSNQIQRLEFEVQWSRQGRSARLGKAGRKAYLRFRRGIGKDFRLGNLSTIDSHLQCVGGCEKEGETQEEEPLGTVSRGATGTVIDSTFMGEPVRLVIREGGSAREQKKVGGKRAPRREKKRFE